MGQAFSGVMKGSHLLIVAIMLAVMPAMAEAVGMGRLKVKSALNEPLNAEIPLTSISRREIRSLEAGLAPRSAFEALGIERPNHLSGIKFNVAKRLDGSYFLQLTTRSPYQEPFLHMLVQVEWAGGRLRREYTALIDPPYLSSARPSSITAPRLQAPAADYEPLPEPLANEELKESVSPEPKKDVPPQALPEPVETLPAPLPEEPTLINKESTEPAVDKAAEMAPALPEPIQEEASATGKSIDQIEAEAFGRGMSAASTEPGEPMPEPVVTAQQEPMPEPMMEAYDRGEGLLGPPHIPIIPVETAPVEPMAASFWAASDQYKVKRGDTLYEIAQRLRSDTSVSLNQVMMAIYEANPRAFYDNNVNNLRSGRILQIPEVDQVRGRSNAAATRQFRAHYDSWQEHKLKLAQAKAPVRVAAEPAAKPAAKPAPAVAKVDKAAERQAQLKAHREAEAKAEAQAKAKAQANAKAKAKADADARAKQQAKAKQDAARKQQAKKVTKPQPKPSKTAKARQTEDLLRIVRASMLAAPAESAQTAETESRQAEKERQMLAKRMDNLEESAETAKLQNKEISNKVGKVQKNIQNQKRLIDVENPSLAKGAPAKPAPAKPAKPAAAKKPAAQKPLKVAKANKPAKPRVAPKPAPKEASIVDTILNIVLGNQFMLMLVGGVVLLGLAIFAIYMKRRRKTLADFEESILSADTTTDDLSTDSQDDLGESGDTSFLSDFSQEGMGNIATDEVDPIAEADVYLAYGRDEQAEEILKDAISKHPERAEVKLKLLEIYHQRNDISGFETLAEELYASGNASAVWSQVAEMGTQLNPDNPMFQGDAPPAGMMGGAEPAAGMGGGMDMTELVPGDTVMDDGSGMDDSLDFDIDTPAMGGGTELVSPPSDDNEISMDLDMGESGGDFNMDMDIGGETEEAAEDTASGEDFALDFNMDTADVGEEEEPSAEIPVSAEDEAGLDFNMDFEDAAGDSGGDEGLELEGDGGLSMGEDEGLSFDMETGDDSSLSMDSGEDEGMSFDMGEDSDLDLSSMEADEDDSGLSALDMVKAEGGGLPENEDGSLDFSLSSDGGGDEDYGLGDDDTSLDLSADFSGGGGDTDVAEAVDVSEAVGSAEAEVDADENWDEAATKLDLAKAYIDMGDADGAKSILDEVMAEGNDEQKAQASELAAQI